MPHTVGYCTNVHAGVDLATIEQNLHQYATVVQQGFGDSKPLGVGLWLPAIAANELVHKQAATASVDQLQDFLVRNQLFAFTINGFPYENFHQRIVKHQVYHPAWWDERRLQYTKQLAIVLSRLLPESESLGSISTLPIGWPSTTAATQLSAAESARQLAAAAANLRQMAKFLAKLESNTGRRIVLAIEPEPGCILQTSTDVVDFFATQFPDSQHRRYLSVCHDICHSAVMMESQTEVLDRYAFAGISVGKVQVSSAIAVDWESMATNRAKEAVLQLADFAEDRYLHQTGRWTSTGSFSLCEDLPELIDKAKSSDDPSCGDSRWVIHFHVPIFLERFGRLATTQHAITECLHRLYQDPSSSSPQVEFSGHFEVETYAWSVLPAAMRQRGLAEDITQELLWLDSCLQRANFR